MATSVASVYELWAIAAGGPAVGSGSEAQSVDAWAVFRGGDPGLPGRMAVAIKSGGIVGYGLSCGDDQQFVDRYAGPSSQFIVRPVDQ